ncbi:MAG: glycosyltransferase family 9 protein [Chloroflexota bacterium]
MPAAPGVDGRRLPTPAASPQLPVLADARRILVIRLDNAGDVILTGPALRAIRAALPSTEITLLTSPAGAHAAAVLPWVDRIETLRAVWQDARAELPLDPARELAFVERLRASAYDAAFVLTSFSQTPYPAGYVCYLAGIPIRVGHAGDFAGSILTHAIPGPAPTHQAERNLHLVRALGVPIADEALEIAVPAAARASVTRRLGSDGLRLSDAVVLAPGASCSARRYAPERFAAVARGLALRTGRPIVVVGTEKERPFAEPTLRAVDGAVDLVGATTLPELAAIIEAAALVIANDSLPLHLADATMTPILATFAGTDREAEWGPRRTPAVLLRQATGCAPCRLFACRFDGHPCLDIAPDDVVGAALEVLAAILPRVYTVPGADGGLAWAG